MEASEYMLYYAVVYPVYNCIEKSEQALHNLASYHKDEDLFMRVNNLNHSIYRSKRPAENKDSRVLF
jgi:hypothetical protein